MVTASIRASSSPGSAKNSVPNSAATAAPRSASESCTPMNRVSSKAASFWACSRPRYPTPMTPVRIIPLSLDPALAGTDELHEVSRFREGPALGLHPCQRLLRRQPRPEQDPVGLLQRRDRFRGEAVPLQPDEVQSVKPRSLPSPRHHRRDIGRDVERDPGKGPDDRVGADPDELVDPDEPADDGAGSHL